MANNAFIEAVVLLRPAAAGNKTGWVDTSTIGHLQFTATCGSVRIVRRSSYPATFAFVKGDVLWFGYGSADAAEKILGTPLENIPEDTFYDEEFFYCAIDCNKQSLTVQTDGHNAVSVFVGTQADRCVITSDFARTFALLDAKHCQLDIRCVVQYLLAQLTYDRTFVQNIQLLYDRKRFGWSTSGERLDLPPDANMRYLHHNRNGNARQFPQYLEHTLETYWTRYVGSGTGGCELSCGLDSSTVAGYLADRGYRLITATALFPKDFSHTQRQKLHDFTQRFSVKSVAIPARDYLDYPYVEVLQGRASQPFYHYDSSPYRTTQDDLYAALAQMGATVVFSGIGGDELFEHVDHRHVMGNTNRGAERFNDLPALQPLLSHAAELSAKQSGSADLPIPLKSHSTLILSALAANDYLAHGLWYVSPLADARLYAYMQTLPLHYCVDKLLLRVYANTRRMPKTITLPKINEDFRHVQVETFHRLKRIILDAINHSILIEHRLLEKKPLLDLYNQLAGDANSEDFATALLFERLLHAELNLRSLGLSL